MCNAHSLQFASAWVIYEIWIWYLTGQMSILRAGSTNVARLDSWCCLAWELTCNRSKVKVNSSRWPGQIFGKKFGLENYFANHKLKIFGKEITPKKIWSNQQCSLSMEQSITYRFNLITYQQVTFRLDRIAYEALHTALHTTLHTTLFFAVCSKGVILGKIPLRLFHTLRLLI